MNVRKLNWPIYAGFVVSLIAFLSYFFVFVWFPVTRDFPWANLLIFLGAAALLLVGFRRAFAADRSRRSKVLGIGVATLSVAVFGSFVFVIFIGGRSLPSSQNAPQVGQKAPDFSLSDTNGKLVSLSELLTTPVDGKTPKGVVLVFYRGYW